MERAGCGRGAGRRGVAARGAPGSPGRRRRHSGFIHAPPGRDRPGLSTDGGPPRQAPAPPSGMPRGPLLGAPCLAARASAPRVAIRASRRPRGARRPHRRKALVQAAAFVQSAAAAATAAAAAADAAAAAAAAAAATAFFAVTGIHVSSVVLTCPRWYPSQPGVMHRLSADPVKDSESWNHSDMCRDFVH